MREANCRKEGHIPFPRVRSAFVSSALPEADLETRIWVKVIGLEVVPGNPGRQESGKEGKRSDKRGISRLVTPVGDWSSIPLGFQEMQRAYLTAIWPKG